MAIQCIWTTSKAFRYLWDFTNCPIAELNQGALALVGFSWIFLFVNWMLTGVVVLGGK